MYILSLMPPQLYIFPSFTHLEVVYNGSFVECYYQKSMNKYKHKIS